MKTSGSILVIAAMVAACGPAAGEPPDGSGSGDGGSESAPPEPDDLLRLATAICAREAACECSMPEPWDEPSECVALHHEGLMRLGEDAEAADDYAFDATCLRELADCWEQLECGESFADACASECAVHRLNLGTDSECESESYDLGPPRFIHECAEDLACLSGHGYSVCDTTEPLQLGESCFDAAYHRHCAPDLYCADEDGAGECQPRVADGGACETSTSCAAGLRCADGTCGAKVQIGGACETETDCITDLFCHPTLAVCAAPAEIGEQCRFPVGVNDELIPCNGAAWCGETVCEAPLEIGSACEYSDGCPDGSACEGGVCTACALGSCGQDPVCAAVPYPYSYPSG